MNEGLMSRIEAFLEEFPFIRRYDVKPHRFSKRPIVQRVDLELIDVKPHTSTWGSKHRYAFTREYTRIIIIGQNGEELAEVKQNDVIRKKFNLFKTSTWFSVTINGETVYEAIKKLDDADKVAYLLELNDRFSERREDFDPDWGLKIILHKIPTGRTFSKWIKEIKLVAQEELKKEVSKIDA